MGRERRVSGRRPRARAREPDRRVPARHHLLPRPDAPDEREEARRHPAPGCGQDDRRHQRQERQEHEESGPEAGESHRFKSTEVAAPLPFAPRGGLSWKGRTRGGSVPAASSGTHGSGRVADEITVSPCESPMRAAPRRVRRGARLHRAHRARNSMPPRSSTRRRAPCARRSPPSIGGPRPRPRVTPRANAALLIDFDNVTNGDPLRFCRRSSAISSAARSSPARSPSSAPTPIGAATRSTSSRSANRRSISSRAAYGSSKKNATDIRSRSMPSSSSSPVRRSGPTSSCPATPTSPRSS